MTNRTLKNSFLTATLLSLGMLAAGSAAAKDRAEGPPRGGHFIERHDVDGDGSVGIDEVTQTVEQHFAKVDANQDGSVTPEEAKAAHQARRAEHKAKGADRKAKREEKRQARFAKRDANSDGQLSQDEVGRMPAEVFAAIDTNGDGGLTPAELKEHKKARKAEHGKRHFEKMDITGDGKISIDEAIDAAQLRFEKLDTNGDEVVSAEEAAAGAKAHRGPRGGKARKGAGGKRAAK